MVKKCTFYPREIFKCWQVWIFCPATVWDGAGRSSIEYMYTQGVEYIDGGKIIGMLWDGVLLISNLWLGESHQAAMLSEISFL